MTDVASSDEADSGPTTPDQGEPARPVLIDTDMAADDWMAILFMLRRPDVDVVAISVAGTGEAHCEPGVRHARELVALAGRPDIPIACGSETPTSGGHAFPAAWRQDVDSLLGLELPSAPPGTDAGTAVALLSRTVQSASQPVTILALGPLTNLAEAFAGSAELAGLVDEIVIMGGAVTVGGNVGEFGVGIQNPFAEWNIYCDPAAAHAVLQSGASVVLVPLDATNYVPVTKAFYDKLRDDRTTAEASFVFDVLTVRLPDIEAGLYMFWDPLAAAILVDETLTTFDEGALGVVTDEGQESGRVIAAENGPSARYATSADTARFEPMLLDTLNGRIH